MFGFNHLATKIIIGLGAVVTVMALYVWGQRGYQKALQQANEIKVIATQRDAAIDDLRLSKAALTRDREISAARIREAQAQEAAANKRLKDLSDALKANPEWADGSLPDSVFSALTAAGTGYSGSAPAPASGASAAVPDASAPGQNKQGPRRSVRAKGASAPVVQR